MRRIPRIAPGRRSTFDTIGGLKSFLSDAVHNSFNVVRDSPVSGSRVPGAGSRIQSGRFPAVSSATRAEIKEGVGVMPDTLPDRRKPYGGNYSCRPGLESALSN